ncbi:MAG: peptidoglycan-associated lipoprotein Pal [Deltaproteobacteria bacterium]
MKKMYAFKCVVVASFLVTTALFCGCAKKTVQTEEGVVTPPPEVEQPAPAQEEKPQYTEGAEEPLESQPPAPEKEVSTILEGRTTGPMLPVYFDFDKFDIRKDQQPRIIGDAEYLKQNPDLIVRVEGNCDERGTNEYNMALGERRANSGKKYLINLGVAASRIKTISYGEERPLDYGHDEAAWAANRRDDFVITE